jgi:hypothetical protein
LDTAHVLIDELATRSRLDAAHHRLGVASEMAENMPDRPLRQQRRATRDRISQLTEYVSKPRVSRPAPLDVHRRPFHEHRAYDAGPSEVPDVQLEPRFAGVLATPIPQTGRIADGVG